MGTVADALFPLQPTKELFDAVAAKPFPVLDDQAGERMQALMERNRPMSDFAAASYMRGLVSVTERVSKMLGDGAEDSGIVVVLPEDKGAFE